MEMVQIFLIVILVLIVAILLLTYKFFYQDKIDFQKRISSTGKILKTENGEIEYSIKGDGLPVLVIHGSGGGFDQGNWISDVAFLKKYKIISVSRFGYLNSPIPKEASIGKQAELYKHLLDFLKIDRVIVAGATTGGASAIQFTNDYHDRVLALILLSAVSRPTAPGDKSLIRLSVMHMMQYFDYVYWFLSNFMRSVILKVIGVPAKTYKAFTLEQKTLMDELIDNMFPMSKRDKGMINDEKMIGKSGGLNMDKISVPTLIIHAKDDTYVDYGHSVNANKKIKNSKLVLYETGGMAMISQLENIRKDIDEFLTATVK